MQLFILDRSPRRTASMLADCHVRKLCLETAQILTGAWLNAGHARMAWMPRPMNPRHPVIRALDTREKIFWVCRYYHFLLREFEFRFGRAHAYGGLAERYAALFLPGSFRHSVFTANDLTFFRAFRNFTTDEPDLIAAYRQYYRYKRTVIRSWRYTRRREPVWLREQTDKSHSPVRS